MPKHAETRPLPYDREQMFDLVADVGRYPEFLPWCRGARVYDRRDDQFRADLVIGFKFFRERFTSRVTLERPERIHVDYIRGPLKYLHNHWYFIDNGDGTTTIDFSVDFEFHNRLFESVVGSLFTEATTRMIAAFERRAAQIYGSADEVTAANPAAG